MRYGVTVMQNGQRSRTLDQNGAPRVFAYRKEAIEHMLLWNETEQARLVRLGPKKAIFDVTGYVAQSGYAMPEMPNARIFVGERYAGKRVRIRITEVK